MATKHYLPSKLPSYLRRLDLEYVRAGRALDHEIIQTARISVTEETSYDNWNGGTYGHDVSFFLPESVLRKVPFADQKAIANRLCEDLNACATAVENEHVENVLLELAVESDPDFQRAVPLTAQPQTNPDTVSFWQKSYLRLFISHRDTHKSQARDLADNLEQYGVSAFVAHDTIVPMSTWQREIEKGLDTMELMLAFVTEDFHNSAWTNQEIGFALGKGIPIIAIKYGARDPVGFIGEKQAMKARFDRPSEAAQKVVQILIDTLGQKQRFQQVLIAAFLASPDWDAARDRFNRIQATVTSLNDEEMKSIQNGFSQNDQLYRSIYLTNQNRRLERFLEKATGKLVTVQGRVIKVEAPEEDIPF